MNSIDRLSSEVISSITDKSSFKSIDKLVGARLNKLSLKSPTKSER